VTDVRRLVLTFAIVSLTASCSDANAVRHEPGVSAAQASALLRHVAKRASERTPEAVAEICTSLADSCNGLSSGWRSDPASAPRTPPSLLCDIALPATPTQAGPRLLVVTGRDAAGHGYVGQVLIERLDGEPVIHEPAFWLGIEYTSLVRGRAWSGTSDIPREQRTHDAAVRASCTNPGAFIAAASATYPSR
jgi:hypothetical protein